MHVPMIKQKRCSVVTVVIPSSILHSSYIVGYIVVYIALYTCIRYKSSSSIHGSSMIRRSRKRSNSSIRDECSERCSG